MRGGQKVWSVHTQIKRFSLVSQEKKFFVLNISTFIDSVNYIVRPVVEKEL